MTQTCKGDRMHLLTQICCPDLNLMLSPKLFKALGEPNRVALLALLAERRGELTVSEAAESLPIDVSVVSRHLRILAEAGILKAEKRGKEVFYLVRTRELAAGLRRMADALEACCPAEPAAPAKIEERIK